MPTEGPTPSPVDLAKQEADERISAGAEAALVALQALHPTEANQALALAMRKLEMQTKEAREHAEYERLRARFGGA